MAVVDLSHALASGTSTGNGLPAPRIGLHLTFEESRGLYAEGTEFCIGRVNMVSATGTYLDAPYHRYSDADDVSRLPLQRCVGLPVCLAPAEPSGEIDTDRVPADVHGHAVLFQTGWDRNWGTREYGSVRHPHLSQAAAALLVQRGAALVGIDSVNVDATTTGHRPVHSTLLAAGVPIVENLTNLDRLAEVAARTSGARLVGTTFHAAPIAMEGMPSMPVRAYTVTHPSRAREPTGRTGAR